MSKEEFSLNGSDGCKIVVSKSEYIRYLNGLLEREKNNENYEMCSDIRDRLKELNQNKDD
jgi:protein-arginine kinase activator protein McsA